MRLTDEHSMLFFDVCKALMSDGNPQGTLDAGTAYAECVHKNRSSTT